MFARFAAAAAVASALIALGSLALLLLPLPLTTESPYVATAAWCFVPLIWGVWAALTPKAWLPQRLPWWGAILGVLLGIIAALVLNLPERVFGLHFTVAQRSIAPLLIAAIYFLLWTLVRKACDSLAHHHA